MDESRISRVGRRDLDLTLLIPCYLGADWIERCLDSVLAQSLDRVRFELLIVINGPRDRSRELAEAKLSTATSLRHRIIESDLASLSNARNIAIQEARGRWLTWLDVDDALSANFLEELLASARPGVVPVARVLDVSEGDGVQMSSPITEQMLAFPEGEVNPAKLWRPLTFAACKLVESDVLSTRLFDVELRSGEDVAFFGPLFQDHGLVFDNTPAHRGATYFRQVRQGSMSRQSMDFYFAVSQRLAVMKHLDDAIAGGMGPLGPTMRSMMHSQALFTHRFLFEHPEQLGRVRRAVAESGLSYYPWHVVNIETDRLAISYNFPPYNDASAMVAAKRLIAEGHQWNVVSNDLSKVRETDPTLHMRVLSAVSQQHTVRNPPYFGAWSGIESFCRDGMSGISQIEEVHGPQRWLYSRSMWPASHYLAALYKARAAHPVHWTAEFSDPLLRDITGKERLGAIDDTALSQEFREMMAECGFEPRKDSLFSWAEYLPYLLADVLLFTNPHQMNYMMSYLEDQRLRELALSKAEINPQPRPPAEWYQLESEFISSPRMVNIGYFGTFYANRGVAVLLDALEALGEHRRKRVRLDIYSKADAALEARCEARTADGSVRLLPPLPYLKFLNLATRYSCLVVNDAESAVFGHQLNPYLPSKLSDYAGSGTPIWGLFEAGSMLSRAHLAYRSPLGDVAGAVGVLSRLLERVTHV